MCKLRFLNYDTRLPVPVSYKDFVLLSSALQHASHFQDLKKKYVFTGYYKLLTNEL